MAIGDLLVVDSSDHSLAEVLKEAVINRRTVLLSVNLDQTTTSPAGGEPSSQHRKFLSQLLRRDLTTLTTTTTTNTNNNNNKNTDDSETSAGFQLYLVVFRSIKEVLKLSSLPLLSPALGDFSMHSIFDGGIVDLEFRKEALKSHLLRLATTHDRPEYHIRHKSLLADLVLHKEQLEEEEENLLEAMTDPQNQSLLHTNDLLKGLRTKEASEAAMLDQIKETIKLLQAFDQQVKVYNPLTQFASAVFCSLQKLSSAFQYFSSSVEEFEQVLARLITKFKSNKQSNNTKSINAHMLHLNNQLLLSVYQHLQVCHRLLSRINYRANTIKVQCKNIYTIQRIFIASK